MNTRIEMEKCLASPGIKATLGGILLMLMAVSLAVACSPRAAPAPAPPAAPAALALSPEEAAWQKVVEAAKKEGKLVSYDFYMVGDIGIRMKRAFKERTGLDVEFITGTGAPLIERIKAERRGGFQMASVLTTSPVLLTQAKIEGLTQAAGPLPELLKKAAWKESPIYDKEGHILASGVLPLSPWVNPKLVKPGEEPKSWRELLQPRWKGKISVSDPDTDPMPVRVYYQLVKKHRILDDVYFRELGKSAVFQPNVRMNAAAVAKGDVDITFTSNATIMSPLIREGAPVKAIDMEEGVIAYLVTSASLLSQGPHPNAARVYVNWWFSREGQLIFHEAQGTESIRKEVPSFIPAPAQLTPKKIMWSSAEDELETAKIQRERVVKNLLLGK